jgi:predicted PurR-regulated permease PerM
MENVRRAVDICWLIVLGGFILYKSFELLSHLATLTTIVIGAIFFAYLIFPLVSWLTHRMALGLAIATVYLTLVLIVGAGFYFVVPALTADVQGFIHDAPTIVHNAQLAVIDSNDPLARLLPGNIRDYLATVPGQVETYITANFSRFASTVFPVLISIVAVGALFVVIPVVAAYLLIEAASVKQSFLGFVPASRQKKAQQIIADLDHVVGGFLRGQLIVAAIVGTLVTILLLVLHVPYAALIGVVAGVLDVIPYVGAIAGWLPAVFIALFTNGAESALFVTIGIVVINQLEGHLIAPMVVSRSVELTPLVVILALIAGGEIAGIPGLLLAVPVAGVLRVLIINFWPHKVSYAQAAPALPEKPTETTGKD